MRILFVFFTLVQTVYSQHIKQGDSLLSLGFVNEAINVYKKEISPVKFYKIGKALQIKGNYDQASDYYKDYLKKDSLNRAVNYDYALLQLELSRFKEAEMFFKKLVNLEPNALFNYYLGYVLEKQHNTAEAKLFYQRSIACDSLFLKSNYRLAVLLTNEKKFLEAKDICNRFLNNKIRDIDMLKLRAQLYFALNNYLFAIEDFEKLIEYGYEDEFIIEKLAISYYETKEYKKSINLFSKLLDGNEEPNYLMFRAKCNGFLGFPEKAEEDIKRVIELKKFSFENEYFYMAYFFQKDEDFKKAVYYYNMTLKEDKNHLEANYQLIAIKDFLGNSSKQTIQNYKDFLKQFPEVSNEKRGYIMQRLIQLEDNSRSMIFYY
ncbi:Tetratricopeptide repeat-containing protein [Flavobacterium sp. 9AF]|uniref:tetratricopeptide repeat protein n=1 Tax=Flavobacterium sp. 9AF TaxID=2653142 RepID=UPI0012F224B3|nr:tetratricopeptide repeat protein [Flavobacterium sp. 9AF]VXB22169.1 Tetratricopeptide repeat-containing protein [Flavobacterium sp. 9AF]